MSVFDFKSFSDSAKLGNFIAVTETLPADLETPVSSFLKIAGREKNAFLLESAEQEERIGLRALLEEDFPSCERDRSGMPGQRSELSHRQAVEDRGAF